MSNLTPALLIITERLLQFHLVYADEVPKQRYHEPGGMDGWKRAREKSTKNIHR